MDDLAHGEDGERAEKHVNFIPNLLCSMSFGRKGDADKEKLVHSTKAMLAGVVNAKVKVREILAGRRHESKSGHKEAMSQSNPANGGGLEMYNHFLFTAPGGECPDLMIRLPYSRTATFEDLRRELEEDYPDKFPSSEFQFLVAKGGLAISMAQEHKWRVHDYDPMYQGGDRTFKKPFVVYLKSIKKDRRFTKSIKKDSEKKI